MKKTYHVRVGDKVLTIYPHVKGWQFCVNEGEKRRYITRKTKAAIEETAIEWNKDRAWAALSPARKKYLEEISRLIGEGEESAVLELLRGRKASASMADAVVRYRAHLEGKARTGKHTRTTMAEIEALAKIHTGTVADVTLATLQQLIESSCKGGNHRKMAVRRALVAFFRWCRSVRLVPNDELTVADMLSSWTLPKASIRVLSCGEFAAVLAALPPEHHTWAMLGAYAGLRPEEIAPAREKRKDGKRGLQWENIDFRFRQIRVSMDTSKVGRARVVPLCDKLLDYLLPLRGIGDVCWINPAEDKSLRKVGKEVFGAKWPQDCIRHSYGTYRNAVLRDLGRVAEEMGTSVDMLHKHYHDPVAEELGKEWFEGSAKVQQNNSILL